MPNLLAILTPPTSTDLVSLNQAKEALGILPGDEKDDTLIQRCIRGASAYFVRRAGRPLALQTVTEGFPSLDRLRLILGLRPLVSVSAVRLDGTTLTTDDYAIEHKASGILYRESGWGGRSGRVAYGISQDAVIERGPTSIEVDYRAGYFLPSMVGTIGAGETALPADIVDAVLDLVTYRFDRRERDLNESSNRIGDKSATFVDLEAPAAVAAVADAYADVIASYF